MVSKGEKKIYGLLGRNIKYSLSPAMHNAAFEHFKINAEYKLFDVEEGKLAAFLSDEILSGKLSGINVTIPYKMAVIDLLKGRPKVNLNDTWVKSTGAANTIAVSAGTISLHNTDVLGFLSSLQETGFVLHRGKEFFVFGAGGAGHAIVIAIAVLTQAAHKSKPIYVYDIDMEHLSHLESDFMRLKQGFLKDFDTSVLHLISSAEDIPKIITKCDLVVNATPLGTKAGDAMPFDPVILSAGAVVYDLVYARETELIKNAKAKGLVTVNGLGMLVNQGAESFVRWNPDVDLNEVKKVMRKAAEKELEKRK